MRISGTDVGTFEADCELRSRQPPWAVGDTFEVVVDPADRSFAALY